MSYESSATLFYGALLPESLSGEVDEDDIEDAGFIAVTFGNFVSGDVCTGIALVKSKGTTFAEKVSLGQPPEEDIEELKEYLKELGVKDCEIGWFNTVTYS